MDPLERLIHLLAASAQGEDLRRMGDRTMAPHPTIRGVFVEGISSINFINEVLREGVSS